MQQVQHPILNVNRGLINLSSTCYVLTLLCSGNSKTKIRNRIRKTLGWKYTENKKRQAETGTKCSYKKKACKWKPALIFGRGTIIYGELVSRILRYSALGCLFVTVVESSSNSLNSCQHFAWNALLLNYFIVWLLEQHVFKKSTHFVC